MKVKHELKKKNCGNIEAEKKTWQGSNQILMTKSFEEKKCFVCKQKQTKNLESRAGMSLGSSSNAQAKFLALSK